MSGKIKSLSREERTAAKELEPERFRRVLEELTKIDAAGIGYIPEEYDIETLDVMVNLPDCHTAEEVRTMVYEVFSYWFSPNLAKPILEAEVSHFEALLALRG